MARGRYLQMRKLILLIVFFIVGFWTGASHGQYTNPDPNATEHIIADDGYANVALGHTFPLYGQTYTNSWMLANGVVMFRNPSSYGFHNWSKNDKGWCCDGRSWTDSNFWNNERLGRYSYAIAPFWTDLKQMDNDGGFFSQTSSTSTKYWWHQIEEFNKSNNENSFSLEIFPSGNYEMEYGNLKITNHNIAIGVAGSLTNAEFVAHEYHNTSGQNYIYTGTTMSHNGNDLVCSYDPLSLTSCAGYDAAYLQQQCNLDPLYDTQCSGYTAAYYTQQCGIDALYDEDCDGYETALIEECLGNPFDYRCESSATNTNFTDDFSDFDPSDFGGPDNDDFFGHQGDDFSGQDDFQTTGVRESDRGMEDTFNGEQQIQDTSNSFQGFTERPFEEHGSLRHEEEFHSLPDNVETEERNFQTSPPVVEAEPLIREDRMAERQTEEPRIREELDPIREELEPLEEPIRRREREEERIVEVKEEIEEIREKPSRELILSVALEQVAVAEKAKQKEKQKKEKQKDGKFKVDATQMQSQSQSGQNSGNFGQDSSFSGNSGQDSSNPAMVSVNFFTSDIQIYQGMAGITTTSENLGENVSQSQNFGEDSQQVQQNLALGEASPIGVTIIPVETISIMEESSPPSTLAERISIQVAERKKEQSNSAAVGQTAALTSLSGGVSLDQYSGVELVDRDKFYETNGALFTGQMPVNSGSEYRMFVGEHRTMKKLIRSQY